MKTLIFEIAFVLAAIIFTIIMIKAILPA